MDERRLRRGYILCAVVMTGSGCGSLVTADSPRDGTPETPPTAVAVGGLSGAGTLGGPEIEDVVRSQAGRFRVVAGFPDSPEFDDLSAMCAQAASRGARYLVWPEMHAYGASEDMVCVDRAIIEELISKREDEICEEMRPSGVWSARVSIDIKAVATDRCADGYQFGVAKFEGRGATRETRPGFDPSDVQEAARQEALAQLRAELPRALWEHLGRR